MTTEKRANLLSWEERPLVELLRLGWPIAVSMISFSVMTLVDTLFVGRLGAAALAGVGLGGTMAFMLLCFPMGLLRGVKILTSQAVGAGQRDEVSRHLGAGLVLAVGTGLTLVVVGETAAPLLRHLSADLAAGDAAAGYLRVRALGVPFALVFVALRESRYGQGDSRSPMIASIFGNALNIALDPVLIYGLELGVQGAAWASTAAGALEAVVLIWLHRRRSLGLWDVRPAHLAALWHIGLPTGLQFSLEVGAFALLAAMISRLSAVEMAAHQIVLQVIHFSFMPGYALADAVSVLTGQAVGAGRDGLVRRIARLGGAAVAVYMGLCGLLLFGGRELIARGFTTDPELIASCGRLLTVAAIFQVFDGANMVARGALRGTGDVRFPAAVCVICSWVCTPPLMWLLGIRAGLGALGGWLGICLELAVGAAILWWRLERGQWRPAAQRTRAERERARQHLEPAVQG